MEQIFGGLAALVVIGLIAATAFILIRYIFVQRGYKTIGGQLLFAGAALLVISKVMDRAPSILRGDYNIVLDAQCELVLLALEEGFEFFCPALILAGIIYKYRAEKSRLCCREHQTAHPNSSYRRHDDRGVYRVSGVFLLRQGGAVAGSSLRCSINGLIAS